MPRFRLAAFCLAVVLHLFASPLAAQTECPTGLQPDEHTVALYKFDETSPGVSVDSSPNGIDATDVGTTVVEGRYCSARLFDGVDDRINMDIVRDSLQGATAWTIEYVARSLDGTNIPELINHNCGNGWYFRTTGSGLSYWIKTTGRGGNCPWFSQPSAAVANDTLWHYYAMTWGGDSLRVYRDGTSLGSNPADGVFQNNQTSTAQAWIGHNDFGNTYSGGLADDLRVSAVTRSADEIRDIALALGLAGPTANESSSAALSGSALRAAHPNPFKTRSTLTFDVATTGRVRLAVYDILGREVIVILDEQRTSGRHETAFDAVGLPGGMYLVRLTADGVADARFVTVIR